MISYLFLGTTCESFNVVRKTKDMFVLERYPIIDCLFDCLSTELYGGGVSIENEECWVQLSRCEFRKCIAAGATKSSARKNDTDTICSGGGAFLDVGTLDVSYCTFNKCTGTNLGCGLYSAVGSTNTMRYIMCKSCKSSLEYVNDVSIDSGGQQHNCISSVKYVNISDSNALSTRGSINFGCHLKNIEMSFINAHMGISKTYSAFLVSTIDEIDIKISEISLINGNFDPQYGCFYVWVCNVILSKFYSSNSNGLLYKNKFNGTQLTVKDSYVSSMDLDGCIIVDTNKQDANIIAYFEKIIFVADFVTCKTRDRNCLLAHMLAVISTA